MSDVPEERRSEAPVFQFGDWDRDAELEKAQRFARLPDRVIAAMWVYHRDLELVSKAFARLKTDHDRLLARTVVKARAEGEKSATVAESRAIAFDEDVYAARVQYRVAEQMVTADREALKILHARLDDLRTQAADARAANDFQARTQT